MIHEGDCRAIGGLKIGRGNRSTRREPAPAPLFPPQIQHDQTRARTRAAAVGSYYSLLWTYFQCVRFEVLTAVTMTNAVFWDVAPCRYFVNWRFGGLYRLHLRGIKNSRAIRSSETSVNKLSTQPHIPEDGILHTSSVFSLVVYTDRITQKFSAVKFPNQGMTHLNMKLHGIILFSVVIYTLFGQSNDHHHVSICMNTVQSYNTGTVFYINSLFLGGSVLKIHSRVRVTLVGVLDWRLHLFTILTHVSSLKLIIATSLMSTFYKSLQHTLSLFSLLSSPIVSL
jgi:hypothetical protein